MSSCVVASQGDITTSEGHHDVVTTTTSTPTTRAPRTPQRNGKSRYLVQQQRKQLHVQPASLLDVEQLKGVAQHDLLLNLLECRHSVQHVLGQRACHHRCTSGTTTHMKTHTHTHALDVGRGGWPHSLARPQHSDRVAVTPTLTSDANTAYRPRRRNPSSQRALHGIAEATPRHHTREGRGRDANPVPRHHTRLSRTWRWLLAKAALAADEPLHQCAVCQRSDISHPELEFRVARDGNDYCMEHIPSRSNVSAE